MDKSVPSDGPERIPREHKHDQAERLTNKHIKTLSFLQDMAKENKILKERIKELEESLEKCKDVHNFAEESKAKIKDIQEAYMARADEMNNMLVEKHRVELMQVQEEKFEAERELKEQMLRMRHEMDALKAANKDLRDTASEEAESDEKEKKLKELTKENAEYKAKYEELLEEMESLRSDLSMIQSKKATDMSQMQELRTENKKFLENYHEAQQKVTELEFRLDKVQGELEEMSKNQDQAILIENLRDKVRQMSLERGIWTEKETELEQNLRDMQALKDAMKESNIYLQNELEKLLEEYGYLNQEYERLRKRYLKDQDKKTFRDFVLLKRELNSLKDENEELKTRKGDGLYMLKGPSPPQPPPRPRKKNSLEGNRTGAKKMPAITYESRKSEDVKG